MTDGIHVPTRSTIHDVANYPAFTRFGHSVLPLNRGQYDENMPLTNAASLLSCHSHNIANPSTMERRINSMQSAGIDVTLHVCENIAHGFGLGSGANAEGWLAASVRF